MTIANMLCLPIVEVQKTISGMFSKNFTTSSIWRYSTLMPKLATHSYPKLLGFRSTVVPLAAPESTIRLNRLLIVSIETLQFLAIEAKFVRASFCSALIMAISTSSMVPRSLFASEYGCVESYSVQRL